MRNTRFSKHLSLLLATLLLLPLLSGCRPTEDLIVPPSTSVTTPPTSPTTVTTEPTAPSIVKESTATISAVGDLLIHDSILASAKDGSEYNFDSMFSLFKAYASAADYAVANLETTLAGNNNGWKYAGYPNFNSPDSLLSAAKNTGFDMLLTINNHSYDTKSIGFRRTAQTVTANGLDRLGTKETSDEPNYILKDINGIRIALMCYSYESDNEADVHKLNGKPLSAEDAQLANTFDYSHLDVFYDEMRRNMAALEEAGADATILFLHWGNEYQTKQNKYQAQMAQDLCDIGIDVIIGGHPHVVQPVELLTSSENEAHKTICIYSLGNFISNQRREILSSIKTGHTEDGVMFSVTFAKYSDGTVIPEMVEALPFWVEKVKGTEKTTFRVIPLDTTIADWKSAFGLTDKNLSLAQGSYDRTQKIIGSGMEAVAAYLTDLVTATEQALGVFN